MRREIRHNARGAKQVFFFSLLHNLDLLLHLHPLLQRHDVGNDVLSPVLLADLGFSDSLGTSNDRYLSTLTSTITYSPQPGPQKYHVVPWQTQCY